jgi:hypothetical protein
VKRTVRPGALRDIQAARAETAAKAAAQPKARKRRPRRQAAAAPVRPVAAPPIERRGEAALARLGESLRLEPAVARRIDELAGLASVMSGIPRGRR